eukprot:COSAG05_NODE_7876_length_760_cov_1.063540_1_plen_21_part_10
MRYNDTVKESKFRILVLALVA